METILNNSEAHGREVASAVWRFSTTDAEGYNAHLNPFPIENNPVNTCDWVATEPQNSTRGMYALWGKVRRFGLSQIDMDALKAPFTCDDGKNSINYQQAWEMYVIANEARSNPKGEMECIAEFWSDDRVGWTFSPAPRFIAIADQIVQKKN